MTSSKNKNIWLVIQNEISQKERNKYCILTHVYGTLKTGIAEPICRAGIETQMYRTDV